MDLRGPTSRAWMRLGAHGPNHLSHFSLVYIAPQWNQNEGALRGRSILSHSQKIGLDVLPKVRPLLRMWKFRAVLRDNYSDASPLVGTVDGATSNPDLGLGNTLIGNSRRRPITYYGDSPFEVIQVYKLRRLLSCLQTTYKLSIKHLQVCQVLYVWIT